MQSLGLTISTGIAIGAISAISVAGCGSDDEACDAVANTGCDNGQVCEVIEGAEEPGCFDPVEARGQVFDLETGSPIAGARIVAVDVNSSPVSAVATTDAMGFYTLGIPSTRAVDGTPETIELTLRADAAGYQSFPGGLRQALPIDTADAVLDEDGVRVIETALTDIGLLALPAGSGTGAITGTIDLPETGVGVLVVAEGPEAGSTIADRTGEFTIFNLPAGEYEVAGYARGVNYDRVGADVAEDATTDVSLALSEAATSTVTGRVELADPGDGTGTSVILVVESTFNETLGRGATPPGLRAPETGLAPDITGAFTLEGVPEGRYVVLAAFEDDALVRDPDSCIAGTELVHQTVGTGETIEIAESFKVTGALDIITPGADGAESVTITPTFAWVDDSSENRYVLDVVDSFGEVLWTQELDGVSGGDVEVDYAGPTLESGGYYQFRVLSTRSTGNGDVCEISTTEDLEGVFFVP